MRRDIALTRSNPRLLRCLRDDFSVEARSFFFVGTRREDSQGIRKGSRWNAKRSFERNKADGCVYTHTHTSARARWQKRIVRPASRTGLKAREQFSICKKVRFRNSQRRRASSFFSSSSSLSGKTRTRVLKRAFDANANLSS